MTQPNDPPTKFHISSQLEGEVRDIIQTREGSRTQRGWFNRTGELPSNPNLAGHDPWALSTQFTTKDVGNKLDAMTLHSQNWTKKVGDPNLNPRCTKWILILD